eukprot:s1392_g3.t1
MGFRQVAAAAARRGDVSAAKAWLQEMKRAKIAPDEVAFTTVLTACARASEADEAYELLQSMRTSAQPPGAVSYTGVRPFQQEFRAIEAIPGINE